ncbi:MAG: NAD(P)(+) transhydrogenase (Re/Si-specific) subunit beta, partial [Gammaproteobacteria bacterium]|nr:NAD(P)(+) transhydrogenase (Re/Si-specific) subunit beta [Gammaproteobacteria bacterium]
MSTGFVSVAYVLASVLFILSLGGLSHQESARRGNFFGIAGIIIAVGATIAGVNMGIGSTSTIILALVIGAVIGLFLANKVEMTQMPQLVALLHSFVGLAAVLVGFAGHLDPLIKTAGAEHTIKMVEIFLGIFIGAITFTGSLIACGKLQGVVSSSALTLPGRHAMNLLALGLVVVLGSWFISTDSLMPLIIMTIVASVLGIHLILAIGGADMPVVVSMLNSYSGWAAASIGFMLGNDLLIVTGALVGSSGAILSYIMCRAMNRSFVSVILGGF